MQGERVTLRPLTRDDLDEVEAWAPHTDPLFLAFNRYPWQRMGKDLWLAVAAADASIERYAIVDDQARVVGVLGLIDVAENGSPMLSIFLGADYVGRGLGSDAVRTLLCYAFGERHFRSVRLYVAAANPRARAVYEKCGFHVTGRHYRPDDTLSPSLLKEPRYREIRRYHRRRNGRSYWLYYEMEVEAGRWREGKPAC